MSPMSAPAVETVAEAPTDSKTTTYAAAAVLGLVVVTFA